MNKYEGVIIIIASRITQIESYDPKLLNKIGNKYLMVLLAEEQCHSQIPNELLEQLDLVEYLKADEIDGIFIKHDPKVLRQKISSIICDYDPNNCYLFTECESNVEIIAQAINGLGIHGFDINKASLFRDKIKMKDYLIDYGVRVPKYCGFLPGIEFEQLSNDLGLPFVIKPKSGAASLGFAKVKSKEDYINLSQRIDLNTYEAEEYIEGELFHLDSTVVDGIEVVTAASEYLYPMARSLEGLPSASILLLPEDKRKDNLLKAHSEVVKAFNVDGNLHAEYFISTTGEVIFLEIACRQPGDPVQINFKQFSGMSQASCYLGLKTGFLSSDAIKNGEVQSFQIYVPKQLGIYKGLNIPLNESKYEIIDEIKIGTQCSEAKTYIDIAAHINVKAQGHQELYDMFLRIREFGDIAIFDTI